MKHGKEEKKTVFKNLDRIYKTSRDIAKKWNSTTIPLTSLRYIINESKPSINTGHKQLDIFMIRYNNMLDSLYNGCESIAKKMDSKSIPLTDLKKGLDIIKNGFNGKSISTSKATSKQSS